MFLGVHDSRAERHVLAVLSCLVLEIPLFVSKRVHFSPKSSLGIHSLQIVASKGPSMGAKSLTCTIKSLFLHSLKRSCIETDLVSGPIQETSFYRGYTIHSHPSNSLDPIGYIALPKYSSSLPSPLSNLHWTPCTNKVRSSRKHHSCSLARRKSLLSPHCLVNPTALSQPFTSPSLTLLDPFMHI